MDKWHNQIGNEEMDKGFGVFELFLVCLSLKSLSFCVGFGI